MNILVLGGGGREHAIIRKLNEDGARIKELFCAPGNPGTDLLATNILINPSEPREVLGVVERHQIDLVVVGPEDPLDKCIIDILRYKNIAAIVSHQRRKKELEVATKTNTCHRKTILGNYII
jgi:phosphoribosylamine--glycine ligase